MELLFTEFKSIFDLLKKFPDEQTCIDHLEALRWNGVVVSPFDANSKVYKCKNNRYKCNATNKYFNVRTNTVFDNTKIPLQKWFMALYIFSSHKKGISSHQLARDITITQKSAWFVLHRLRMAFDHPNFKKVIYGTTELDETFVGGKDHNKHLNKKGLKDKTTVFGMLERESGEVRTEVVRNTWSETLTPIVEQNVSKEATLMTDGAIYYNAIRKMYPTHSVNHFAGEYVRGVIHTNTIENFWSLFKRGIVGIYHQVSPKHLDKYLDEFALRYNTRQSKTQSRFDLILSNVAGNRLTYKKLISND